ncbi:hypothetical protein ABFA07_012833 [Porites harrisoni]
MRRKFITEEAKSSKEILDMCPYLGKSSHVRSELCRILDKNCVKGAEDRLVSALKVILRHSGEKLTNTQVVEAVHVIQQRTKRKGSNSAVLKFQDPATPPDKLFKDKKVEFSLVCRGTSEEVEQVFVCGEDQAFFECDCELPRALVDLIAAYYVFDVKYPQCFSGVLYFLQEVVLLQVDSEFKGTKYATFMAEFKKESQRK